MSVISLQLKKISKYFIKWNRSTLLTWMKLYSSYADIITESILNKLVLQETLTNMKVKQNLIGNNSN